MQATQTNQTTPFPGAAAKRESWLDRPLVQTLVLNGEMFVFAAILLLAVVSRFYLLEPRVMSHDENSHVYYSWRLYRGEGFAHDPLMHGPFQFHILALTYFMFGDNDFTARIPAVLFSIATVAFLWFYRRYLGRIGAAIGAILMVISPYMLYYGRYVRNEAFVGLFGVITLWAILRYLETGKARYMYWLTAVMVLHFATKETSFIYAAQALLFLALWLVYRIAQNPWPCPQDRRNFLLALLAAGVLVVGAGGAYLAGRGAAEIAPIQDTSASASAVTELPAVAGGQPMIAIALAGLALVALLAAAYFALSGYSLASIRRERSFDLLILLGTLVLPQLSAFPIFLLGWTLPTNAGEVAALTTTDLFRIGTFLVPMFLISVLIGSWWNRREWLINAAIWYAIFIVFYTTVFTNGAGFFTGMVGSLGYWLKQQDVNRGGQPWYYYWLIQVPVYEFLPALGSLLAIVYVIFGKPRRAGLVEDLPAEPAAEADPVTLETAQPALEVEAAATEEPQALQFAPVVELLGFWVITSLAAYSVAGEKMPWLTVHITMPMILLSGWSFGALAESIDWSVFRNWRGWVAAVVLPLFLASILGAIASLLGPNPPFQGKELGELQATSTFLTAFLSAIASGVGLFYLVRPWPPVLFNRLILSYIFLLLAFITARTAFKASYVSYNDANELLVYAHSATGVKQALAQIEELSRRTSNGLGMAVAYDNETSYPYLWYLRNYTDLRYYGANPTRSLRDVPAILVGDANYGKIEPVVGQAYLQFEYIRLWWPNQDYFDLSWERIWDALSDPSMRSALFEIWLNRDYTQYGIATNKDMSLPNWSPAARMRLYIRKDIAMQLWNYGAAPAASEAVQADPYEGKQVQLQPAVVLGGPEAAGGLQLNKPRGIAVATDGSLYVADTSNHRILHIDSDGNILHQWGSFADITSSQAPGGGFNEPWGIAVGPDGSVYVADTWNHRIQRFKADGSFIQMWGYFGQAEQPEAFWGPRDVAVDTEGRVYVTDTGNKRIVVFDADGNYVTQFGQAGMVSGEFDEPVGLAVDHSGRVYVADTWNQRIQVFSMAADGSFQPINSWDVVAWYGQSLDNKPYIESDSAGHVYVADPEGYRVLEFSDTGEFIRYWGDDSTGTDGFGLAGGLAADDLGGLWVTDPGNNRLLYFMLQQ